MTQTLKNKKFCNKTKKNIYNKTDYKSGDGMLTTVWGPAMWHYIHTMSFNYPDNPTAENKKHYKEFVYNLRNVLPCKYCRINLTNNLKKKPLEMCHMKNRETFSRYIYELHEVINKMLNKKSNLTYYDIRERYEHFRARCTDEKPKVFTFKTTKRKKEKGCTEPLYGKKAKCVINIVPQEDKRATFNMDKKCIKSRE
jgi:predicted nucleotidyltransferase